MGYAEAEADPYLLYGGYNYAPYHYGGWPYAYHGLPVVKAAEEPAEDAEKKVVEKRDAEEPEAAKPVVPLVYGGWPYAYTHPLTYTPATGCQNHMGAAVPCAYGSVVAPAAAAEEVKVEKREAEAEADPEAWWYGNFYNGWYGHHAAYR